MISYLSLFLLHNVQISMNFHFFLATFFLWWRSSVIVSCGCWCNQLTNVFSTFWYSRTLCMQTSNFILSCTFIVSLNRHLHLFYGLPLAVAHRLIYLWNRASLIHIWLVHRWTITIAALVLGRMKRLLLHLGLVMRLFNLAAHMTWFIHCFVFWWLIRHWMVWEMSWVLRSFTTTKGTLISRFLNRRFVLEWWLTVFRRSLFRAKNIMFGISLRNRWFGIAFFVIAFRASFNATVVGTFVYRRTLSWSMRLLPAESLLHFNKT